MFKRFYAITALTLALLPSFSQAKSLRKELYNCANALSKKWLHDHISQLDVDQKQLIYNILGLSTMLCIAPTEDIYNAYLQCTKYIDTQNEASQAKKVLAQFQQMVEMVNRPYLEFLHIKTKQLRSLRADLDENDIEQAQMMQTQKFMVTVVLSFYSEIHNHITSLNLSNDMHKCMFDEFGLIPIERRQLALPEPELISQLFTMLHSGQFA